MDAVEYTRGSQPLLEIETANAVTFVSQTLKNFEGVTSPHCMCSLRKLTVYNKLSGTIKILQRLSMKAVDLAFDAAVVDVSALHPDGDTVAVTTQDGKISLVKVTEMPDKSVAADVVAFVNVEGAVKTVIHQRVGTSHSPTDVRAGKQMVVFTAKNAVGIVPRLDVSDLACKLVHGVAAAAPTVTPAAASAANGVVAFASGQEVHVQVIEKLGTSVLSKPWVPHGAPVNFVHVFARSSSSTLVMTMAGNEAGFWAVEKDSVALLQTAVLNDAADSKVDGAALVAVDADEDYAFVVDSATGRFIVFELGFKSAPACVERITEWTADERIVSIAPIYRKVAAAQGAPPRHEMVLIARTATGLKRFALDQQRLNGPGNVQAEPKPTPASSSPASAPAARSSGSAAGASDLVKRFGLDKVAAPAAAAPTPGFTQITSTSGGTTTTKSTVDPRFITEALQEQQRSFAAVLRTIDTATMGLERAANEALGALRAQQAQAVAAGEASAKQNAAMIFGGVGAGGAAAAGGESSNVINQEVLAGFTAAITDAATITVQQALTAGLKHHAMNAADRAAAIVANANERDGLQLPKLSTLPSMQGVAETLDKSQAQVNELFRRQKEQDAAKYKALVQSVRDKAVKQNQATATYLKELQVEIAGLKADMANASALPSAPADAAESDEQAFNGAVKLAELGQWQQALTKIANVGKPQLLIRFLETDFISANRDALVEPAAQSVALFLSVVQQLSANLGDNVGIIPSHAEWMMHFTLPFDEYAQEKPDAQFQAALKASAAQFSNVADNIALAREHKSALDRHTRRTLTTLSGAIETYGL